MSTRRNDLSQMAGKAQPARLGRPAVVDEPPQVPRAGVLVGLDGSPSSWDAFWWACGESRRRGQRLLAVFVSHAAGVGAGVAAVACAFAPLPSVVYEWQSAADELASRLQAEVERHAAEQGVDVTFLHCRGEPAGPGPGTRPVASAQVARKYCSIASATPKAMACCPVVLAATVASKGSVMNRGSIRAPGISLGVVNHPGTPGPSSNRCP